MNTPCVGLYYGDGLKDVPDEIFKDLKKTNLHIY